MIYKKYANYVVVGNDCQGISIDIEYKKFLNIKIEKGDTFALNGKIER